MALILTGNLALKPKSDRPLHALRYSTGQQGQLYRAKGSVAAIRLFGSLPGLTRHAAEYRFGTEGAACPEPTRAKKKIAA